MAIFICSFFIVLTIGMAILVRDHLAKNSTLILVLMALSSTICSGLFVVVSTLTSKEPVKTFAVNNVSNNVLVGINALLLVSTFLIWFLARNTFERNKSSFLVELVGAWNKVDIDNSIENLIDHGMQKPQDREWVTKVLKILKNYKDEAPKEPSVVIPPDEGLMK